jgi:2-isopropylmalate synthase
MAEDKVLIFDTTLRDGEQSPGVALNAKDKLEIARALERLGVDIIEAGFPASSPGDLDAVATIAEEVREMARTMVARAAKYCPDVEFSPMDATRSDPNYVYQLVEECIDAGATTVNIPDTVGYAIPYEFEAFIRSFFEKIPNIHKAVISVHCHNDLGLAVANSLAAVRAGARQVECTINGIGERAGNASLEEIVMAIRTRSDLVGLSTNVDTTQLMRTSRLVSDLTGLEVQPNKAIVGANAFRHQSGVHQDGILKLLETYEIMDARDVGLPRGGILVLNKNSGRHGVKARLEELGFELNKEELNRVFAAFKELADKKGEIDDRDLEALVADERRTFEELYHLDLLQVSCGNQLVPTATVRLTGPEGKMLVDTATNVLTEFAVKSVTEGIDAIGEVTVRIESGEYTYMGRGGDTDIVVASAKALLNALNRLLSAQGREQAAPTPS